MQALRLLPKQKCQRFGKSPCPRCFVVHSTFVDDQPQTRVVQSCAPQNPRQFAHVVDHALIFIPPPCFGGSSRQVDSLRPAFHSSALPDQLPVRGPERRTLQQQS